MAERLLLRGSSFAQIISVLFLRDRKGNPFKEEKIFDIYDSIIRAIMPTNLIIFSYLHAERVQPCRHEEEIVKQKKKKSLQLEASFP
jgi:hypothetical protein